ncbi:flagellar biosynthesis protein FlhF [Thermodesulfobium acidiphilum]|uniref:Flagellar biosynthesis protein FlhF n=1 Tax=Thermodesulfobium acidiphilum TaxID=1794699 RepID=A0A2R4VYI2_THEAF|nr:hypothetical protein [Thermodesulfobium acidiphilum]AWB09552.1 flagellar biosynthesis protein FlhF [Thermodesulfobium acidiphilum]
MNVKRYIAKTIPEAILMIRRDLGEDALILYSRPINTAPRWMIWRKENAFEVIATVNQESRKLDELAKEVEEFKRELQVLKKSQESLSLLKKAKRVDEPEVPFLKFHNFRGKTKDSSILISTTGEFDAGARYFFKGLGFYPFFNERAGVIALAFLGPTGAGKTTTIAKIAARMSLLMKKRVCLITLDTFRIAALDQLKAYADIMELPFFVAHSPKELKEIVKKEKNSIDLFLIDTMGFSPFQDSKIKEISAFLSTGIDTEIHLVLCANYKPQELNLYINKYKALKPVSIIWTKLDEVVSLGHIIELSIENNLPISLFGTGQSVPDNLEVASDEFLSNQLNSKYRDFYPEGSGI